MKIKKLLIFFLMFSLLCGCKSEDIKKNTENQDIRKQFVNQISKEYHDFNILDLTIGSSKNNPIMFVGVGENKNDGTSSTLFISDENGIIQMVTLASDNQGRYIEEDGLVLDKNTILISLKLIDSKQNEEIHDFKMTVTKQNGNIVYSSEETIRKE